MNRVQWIERSLTLVLVAALACAVWAALQWHAVSGAAAAIEELAAGHDPTLERGGDASPEVRLGQALQLARAGREQDAQDLLDYLASHGGSEVRRLAFYNLGNLRLRQALAKLETGSAEHAVPLVDMAKGSYRQALALGPEFWDGKYNLELAMRLLPEMDRISNGEDELPPEAQKKIWTGVPGFPRGLP